MTNFKPIAMTMGEPAGIGGEIALKAWANKDGGPLPPFFTIDDPARLQKIARDLHWPIEVIPIEDPAETTDVFRQGLPVLPLKLPAQVKSGEPNPANATSVVAAIDTAVELVTKGYASAIVTNPIHKNILYENGFGHPGHTEYLAKLAGENRSAMMLACPGLRTVPVTTHVSLSNAIRTLTTKNIIEISNIAISSLKQDFGIEVPQIAIAALNPHGGEQGRLGVEEHEIIQPAIDELKRQGANVAGPAPADTLFHAQARENHDAVICMYHDQALIPLKTIDFVGGVNITMGLPFVRTSPDHGTAFEISGLGIADETSLVSALRMAADIANRRLKK